MSPGKRRVKIFDTTLRDGEQCPGASLETKQKLEVAQQLARLGVDVIEAGFPIASPGDFEAVKEVASKVKGPVICGLARAIKGDIDAAYESLKPAKQPRIHVFLATSKIHMQYKLKKAEEEILRQSVRMVKYTRGLVEDVEFSPEDASRTEPDFLYKVIESVIDAGASTINIPDTVGYALPEQFGELIAGIFNNVPNINKAIISVHCHNDLGLAVANSLAAIRNGALQVECTVNGIGERAGNASMEEIVMALRTRSDVYKNVTTGIHTKEIYKASRLVSQLTGMVVQANKAIVGANAFSHESGIHQDGVLKERITYEIMHPRDIGLSESRLVLGKHSGRHAFSKRIQALGMQLDPKALEQAFERFKKLADKKKEVYDEDLVAIVEDEINEIPETWQLDYIHVSSGNHTIPTATVRLKRDGEMFQDASSGDGPVDACYRTVDRITGFKGELIDYSIRAVTEGKDALGEVSIKVKLRGQIVTGRAASTDIVEASVRAYLNAVNKAVHLVPAKRAAKESLTQP
ncbi:MAG: 2-isopropylmalate synthase [Candidatus Omnitrophica bacterium]|nr:2-isopropylmalate synthase [Candidatus Omnitrophota bacterium]